MVGLGERFRSFYSSRGRSSVARFAVVAAVCAAVLWACGFLDYTWGQLANIGGGGVAGAALGKLIVEAVRRLRDAGWNLRIALAVALVVGVAYALLFIDAGSAWTGTALDILAVLAAVLAAVTLLWPGKAFDVRPEQAGWRGPAFALACMAGGAVVMGGIAWISIGMDDNAKRVEAWRAAHDGKDAR